MKAAVRLPRSLIVLRRQTLSLVGQYNWLDKENAATCQKIHADVFSLGREHYLLDQPPAGTDPGEKRPLISGRAAEGQDDLNQIPSPDPLFY